MAEKVDIIRRAGSINRYHTERILGVDTVGTHSWNVTVLIVLLHPNPSARLIKAALFHDVGEAMVGDLPYPAKRQWPKLAEQLSKAEDEVIDILEIEAESKLPKDDYNWLKACDALEAGLFAKEQLELGNTRAREIYNRVFKQILKGEHIPTEVQAFVEELRL